MPVSPYVYFDGRCDEAIAFYKGAVGAEVKMLMRFKDMPPAGGAAPPIRPEMADKVMHASLTIAGSDVLVSDGQCIGQAKFDGFALTLTLPDVAAVERTYQALLEGGQVVMPLAKTFFTPMFGMLADQFGVHWLVMVEQGR